MLDGDTVDFPTGFPLVEGEWEREPAKASDDQIAMLQRMFGETPTEDGRAPIRLRYVDESRSTPGGCTRPGERTESGGAVQAHDSKSGIG